MMNDNNSNSQSNNTPKLRRVFEVTPEQLQKSIIVPPRDLQKHRKKRLINKKTVKNRNSNITPEVNIDPSIKAATWRGKAWLEALSKLNKKFSSRLPNGKALFQARLIEDFKIAKSKVYAFVNEKHVSIIIKPYTTKQWQRVIEQLSDTAVYTTALLNAELPEGVTNIFKQCGLSLFPERQQELTFKCDCNPRTMPCDHVAALILATAEALDKDPFNFLLIRGMQRDEIMEALRTERSGETSTKTRNRLNIPIAASNLDIKSFYKSDDLSDYKFHISKSTINTPILKRLGNPLNWNTPLPLEAIIAPIYEQVSNIAYEIGQQELELNSDNHWTSSPLLETSLNTKETKTLKTRQILKNTPKIPKNTPPKLSKETLLKKIANLQIPKDLAEQSTNPEEIFLEILWSLYSRGPANSIVLARRTRRKRLAITPHINFLIEEKMIKKEITSTNEADPKNQLLKIIL